MLLGHGTNVIKDSLNIKNPMECTYNIPPYPILWPASNFLLKFFLTKEKISLFYLKKNINQSAFESYSCKRELIHPKSSKNNIWGIDIFLVFWSKYVFRNTNLELLVIWHVVKILMHCTESKLQAPDAVQVSFANILVSP